MCGIIGVKNLKDNVPVNNVVRTLYENQKLRGTDGFGFVGLNAKGVDTYRATHEKDILGYLDNKPYDEILFHHRLPTSTTNVLNSTHPFVINVKDKRYYFVHNGIVNNDDELKEKHEKLGIKYKSKSELGFLFNDSEALGWEFCLWLNDEIKEFEAKGSVALICLETDKTTNRATRLFFYRNKPAELRWFRGKNLLVISSEGNDYNEVKAHRVYYYDYGSKQIRKFKQLVIEQGFTFKGYNTGYFDKDGNEGKNYRSRSDPKYRVGFQTDDEWNRQDGGFDSTLRKKGQKKLPMPSYIPAYANSDDDDLLSALAYLKERRNSLLQEEAILITNGLITEADNMVEDIEEVQDIIQEIYTYFNNPDKTIEDRDDLISIADYFLVISPQEK